MCCLIVWSSDSRLVPLLGGPCVTGVDPWATNEHGRECVSLVALMPGTVTSFWYFQFNFEIYDQFNFWFFRCASISWFQVVSGWVSQWVIDIFLQLAHLRVFQIIFFKIPGWSLMVSGGFFGYSRFLFGCSWFHVGFYIFWRCQVGFSWFFKIPG